MKVWRKIGKEDRGSNLVEGPGMVLFRIWVFGFLGFGFLVLVFGA